MQNKAEANTYKRVESIRKIITLIVSGRSAKSKQTDKKKEWMKERKKEIHENEANQQPNEVLSWAGK